jgi:hypothetical protein
VTKIGDGVERLVREALAAVVGKDSERLQRAIAAFPDNESMTKGIRLATAVALYTLQDLHEGQQPTDDELAEVAGDIAKAETWTDVSSEEIVKYLTAAYHKTRVNQVLPMERVIIVAWVVAANLVSSYHGDHEEWWDYLDRAESVIEATPEP